VDVAIDGRNREGSTHGARARRCIGILAGHRILVVMALSRLADSAGP
jgi:hypothetical protein